jgi:hypothetical protein
MYKNIATYLSRCFYPMNVDFSLLAQNVIMIWLKQYFHEISITTLKV